MKIPADLQEAAGIFIGLFSDRNSRIHRNR